MEEEEEVVVAAVAVYRVVVGVVVDACDAVEWRRRRLSNWRMGRKRKKERKRG